MRKWTWDLNYEGARVILGTGPCDHGEETTLTLEPWSLLTEAELQFIVDALNAAEAAKEDWLDLWSVSVGPIGDSILLFNGNEVGRISDLMTEQRIAGIANLGERENRRLVVFRELSGSCQ